MRDYLLKMTIIGLSTVSLLASGGTSGGGGTDGGTGTGGGGTSGGTTSGGVTVTGTPLALVNPNKALGSYTESGNKKEVSAELTFRANSAFLNNNTYSQVSGHKLTAKFGHTEAGNISVYLINASEFSGILTSTTAAKTRTEGFRNLSSAELNQLKVLRIDIAALENDITTKPGDAQIGTWKQSLKGKLEALASLISYEGLQVSLRELASGNGFYGLFVNVENGEYKQLSGIYALANGKTVANYATLQGAGGTSEYASKFSGAAVLGGIQLIDLKGNGTVSANFSSQTLTGNFAVSNEANTETGTIAFSGGMSANAGGKTGLVFNTNNASFTNTSGTISTMSGGNAEAALVDGGNSILGSVNITNNTNGGNAIVGGFGGDK
ncbi:MAG: hypothetical protein OCD03_14395 [Hyphomicrobiales bacterium]